jgi:TonB family protein
MRTIISFGLALFIHLGIFYFLLPKKSYNATKPQTKLSTIDLSHFNIQKNVIGNIGSNAKNQGPINKPSLSGNQIGAEKSATQSSPSAGANAETIFINFEQPEYPRIARAKGLEGKVKIKVYFNNQGTVASVDILESSTHIILDEAVKKSAQKWVISNSPNSVFEKTFEFKLKN